MYSNRIDSYAAGDERKLHRRIRFLVGAAKVGVTVALLAAVVWAVAEVLWTVADTLTHSGLIGNI